MHFILSGPHTSLHIYATISIIKKLQHNFPKMRGGVVRNSSENSSDLAPPSIHSQPQRIQSLQYLSHLKSIWPPAPQFKATEGPKVLQATHESGLLAFGQTLQSVPRCLRFDLRAHLGSARWLQNKSSGAIKREVEVTPLLAIKQPRDPHSVAGARFLIVSAATIRTTRAQFPLLLMITSGESFCIGAVVVTRAWVPQPSPGAQCTPCSEKEHAPCTMCLCLAPCALHYVLCSMCLAPYSLHCVPCTV